MSERTVFGVPRVPEGMLVRESLLARVGRAPLTVVRGAGGSGKTVLMSQAVSVRETPGAWVTVEPDIGDRLAFWSAVADAGSNAGLELGMPVREDDGDAVRSALVRAFRERHEPFLLVIDDAHDVRDAPVFDDLLDLLRQCPAVSAIVGTRTQGPLEAPRRSLTLDIEIVGPDDLGLTVRDIERLVGDRGSRHGTAEELLEASGGNPLLLRAILAGASTGSAARDSAAAIVGDLLTGLFEREGVELAEFASSTAIPDDVDTALAEQLSGVVPARVAAMLASLESDGMLMRREVADGARFRYHPLVREVLRAQLRRTNPNRYQHLSLLASAAAERDRQFVAALRHAVDAEDYTRASDICLRGGLPLLRSRGAAAVLQQVPLGHVARLPFVAIVLALTANARGERWKALELMTLALEASRASRSRQRPSERIGLALVESAVLRITGRASDSVAAARRMGTMLDETPVAELEEIADQIDGYRLQGALSLFRAGLLSEAQVAAERAGASVHALQGGRPEALGAASVIAAVHAIRGEAVAAAGVLRRIDESDYPPQQRDGYVGSPAHLARGILALEGADLDGAQLEADFVLERVNLEHAALFSVLGSLVWLWREQPQIGLRLLEDREGHDRPRARMSREDRRAITASRVLLHAALGRLGAAHETLRELDRADPVAAVLEAHLLLLEQRPGLVIERMGRAGELPGPRLAAAGDLLLACASLLRDDEGMARAALRRFLAIGALHGVTSPFVLVPDAQRPALLALAAALGADPAAIARLGRLPALFRGAGARVLLTRREAEMLEAIRRNVSQAETAAALGITTNTVKSQTRTLYRKLGASNRDGALRAAYLQGLLEGPVGEPSR